MSSGGDGESRISERRRANREAAQQRARQRRLRKQLLTGAGALVAVAIIAVVIYMINEDQQQEDSDQGLLGGVQTIEVDSAAHVTEMVEYEQTPPVGGPHWGVWQNCGYYPNPINSENAVHSMEHGAVWITYQPDLPAAQVDSLRERAESTTYVLVSPFPDLPAPVVASAWGVQLQLESTDDPALAAFIREYRDGPQALEPGAPCTGGTSTTL